MISEDVKGLLKIGIDGIVASCKKLAPMLLEPAAGEMGYLAMAWYLAQNATLTLEEELRRTPGGRALLDNAKLEAERRMGRS